MPHPEDMELLERDPLAVRSQAYDLVLNGWELGSGSVRIHRPDVQQRIFSLLGIEPEDAKQRFGFLLDAFRYGAPPHAGFAVGVDRFVAILAGEENIREVIAFPKTQSGARSVDQRAHRPRSQTTQRARPDGDPGEVIHQIGRSARHRRAERPNPSWRTWSLPSRAWTPH